MKIFVLFGLLATSFSWASENKVASIQKTVRESHQFLKLKKNETHWNMTAYVGELYLSQYYLTLRWLDQDTSAFDTERLRETILSRQLSDGSWPWMKDPNFVSGSLDATFFNYWFLKVLGHKQDTLVLKKARKYLLSKGGAESISLFSKMFLALFGQYDWDIVPQIPVMVFRPHPNLSEKNLAQWVGPHLLAISYLRNNRVFKTFDKSFNLSELFIRVPRKIRDKKFKDTSKNQELISLLLERQREHGSWGGYTLSTMLSMMSLNHYSNHQEKSSLIQAAIEKGGRYLQNLYLKAPGISAYEGSVCDGRYWDTVLIGLGLLESGQNKLELAPIAHYLKSVQSQNGGFPFGIDFETYPDIDDTSFIIRFLKKVDYQKNKQSIERAHAWVLSMQNRDGGWGAFDKNNNPKPIINAMASKFSDSADLYDESSADVTAHALEALSDLGHTPQNSKAVRDGIKFLEKNVTTKNALWRARWGVNYIYGTSAVINVLTKLGYTAKSSLLVKASKWLLSVQNKDGGFGETTLADRNSDLAGKGISTASQTAWALMALLDLYPANHPSIERAVSYLQNTFDVNKMWVDQSVVGIGHPNLIYMVYPSYPKAFPLMALGKYLQKR